MHLLRTLEEAFYAFITETYALQTTPSAIDFTLNVDPAKQQFGDISSNAALVLAKLLGQPPRTIAQKLAEFRHPALEKIEIAGPGFLNMFLTQQAFATIIKELAEQKEAIFKKPASESPQRYSLEFVSANPTGPLHLGHGRGGIIGDVFARILRFRGHDVTTEFYINDAGAQIKKLGLSFKARCEQQLGKDTPVPEDGYQGEYLVALAEQCIAQEGEKIATYPESFFEQYAKGYLLEKIKTTLASYGITFDVWFSEKTLHESGAIDAAIAELQRTGFIYEKEGALWFASTRFGDDKDRVVKRNNGELTYVAADIAYLLNKLNRGFQKLVMVLGQDHHSYVTRLKAVMQACNHNPDDLSVILYQLVTLKESGEQVRMSKRAGRIITLEDVIEAVGTDVARFFYLNRKADAHLEFDIALALKHTEENPVFYIQYAYVRTASILEKAHAISALTNISAVDSIHVGDAEKTLLKKILELDTVLKNISRNEQTHALAYYLLELAHEFHRYYAAHKVINENDVATSRARLLLVTVLRNTFALCLDLLGISKPERM